MPAFDYHSLPATTRSARWLELTHCSDCSPLGRCYNCHCQAGDGDQAFAEGFGVTAHDLEGTHFVASVLDIWFAPDAMRFVFRFAGHGLAYVSPRNIHLFTAKDGLLSHLIGKTAEVALASDGEIWLFDDGIVGQDEDPIEE